MGLQKRINKWLIKKTIGSEYVYQIEADEKIKRGLDIKENQKSSGLTGFLKDGLKEMEKEVKKKIGE